MHAERLWTLLGALAWLVFFAVTIMLPARHEGAPVTAQIASIFFGVVILMAILLAGERPRWPAAVRWAMFLAGILAVALPFMLNLRTPSVRAIVALGLLAIALPAGYWIGDRMEKVTNLVPLAVAMSFADIFSVYQGPTRRVAQELTQFQQEVATTLAEVGAEAGEEAARAAASLVRAPLADYIIVHLPVAGTGATAPVLGIGDFVVLAFLFRAAWVHGLSVSRIFAASLLSLVVALAASQLLSQALPALPFIALGVVGYLYLSEPRLRRLDRQEALLSLGAAVLFTVLIAGKWIAGTMGL